MGATNIQDAKLLIQSSTAKDRLEGLKDLIHILRHNRGKPTLEALGNKAYLALCETLFQCLRNERASFFRKMDKGPKALAPLIESASALRHVIATGVRTIKSSTVEMIIGTILEVLPDSRGILLKPLMEHLPKALRSLLEYQPHVERLSKDCWDDAIDFCIKSLSSFFASSEPAVEAPDSASTSISSRARTPFDFADLTSSRASPRAPVARTKSVSDEASHIAEDFVHCLHSLVRASNAPLSDKADAVLAALLQYLQHRTGRGSAAAAALAAINSVLVRTTLQSLELTKHVVQELLPLMKSMWSEPMLRDEIMITLMYAEAHVSSLLSDQENETVSFDLEALVEAMYSDYRKRQETTAHQYLEEDHLCFRHLGQPNQDTHPLNTSAFSMETEHLRFEGLWSTVSTIARFSYMLDKRRRMSVRNNSGAEESLSKRVRVTQLLKEYLRHVLEPRSNAKRAAMQVVAFMVQEGPVDEEDLQSMLERLTSCISDENPAHSVWAMIAIAGAALQQSATRSTLKSYWISAWQTASRAITSPSLSRAACHLMDVLLKLRLVPFPAVSNIVQSMLLSIELSGPAMFTESSSSLLSTIMRERIQENPTNFNSSSERILSWLLTKWTPSSWSERNYSALNSHHSNAQDVLRVLHACLGKPYHPATPAPFFILGPIGQARSRTSQYEDLARYLLLLDDKETYAISTKAANSNGSNATFEHHTSPMESRIFDFCLSEVEKAGHLWKEMAAGTAQGITSDMMRIVTTLCIVAPAMASLCDPDDRRVARIESSTEKLVKSFVGVLTKPQTEQYKIDAVLETCAKSFTEISTLASLRATSFKSAGVHILARHLPVALADRREIKQSFYAEEEDFMEVDDMTDSQPTALPVSEVDVPRNCLEAESDVHALRACCTAYLNLMSSIQERNEQSHEVPSQFVDYIVSLPESELLRSRRFLRALWESDFELSQTGCLNILDCYSEALIDPRAREYNTSEVANGMLVEVLIGTASIWGSDTTDREAQDLYENVEALYAYYVKEIEKGGVRRSAHLQEVLAVFLHGLLKYHPNFGQTRKVPSVRTSLFELLARGEMNVKHHIAKRLPSMFEDFVLSEHGKILQDVDTSLPGDDEGIEGIAVRLLVLSKLASRWHTLLRQCVYLIFATAGSVHGAAQHASRCILSVARSRGLDGSQSLLRLFAPQVIYTWLDRGRLLADIPYVTFGYPSLVELLRDIAAEATGQVMMRGRKGELEYLADQLETSVPDLLSVHLGKAAAYTIAWDTCKGSARDKTEPKTADLLKELVGSDKYYDLIRDRFPQVLGYILQTMDHEERVPKALEKKPVFTPAAQVFAAITEISHSTQDLNIGIQPAFPAYYLPDQLERLCRRSGDNLAGFWSPSTYTFVMRSLLDRIHPALGSLYARSIIRKIRIVVALAGAVTHAGYPLQMTLQSLRPFLTDVQCAEDTAGIMQYLFEHGTSYLSKDLGFVTGIGLSILISVRAFLGLSQESTTQQSQHVATMNAATRFHAWLSEYLKRHADAIPGDERSSTVKAFKLITTAASQVKAEGNSARGSEESKLLLEILDDVKSGRRLLNKTSREVALSLLCQNFQPASMARDDILGLDHDAAEYAPLVWESCRRTNVGDGYLLWAAKVLGRAYSAYGEVKRSTSQTKPWTLTSRGPKDSLGKSSRDAIINEVIELFYSDNRGEVSLAEDAIRRLISRCAKGDSKFVGEMLKEIPEPIGKALGLYIPEHVSITANAPPESLESAMAVTGAKPLSMWIRDLAMALCRVAAEDPLLGSMSDLLRGIDHMAGQLLPYILHLVLLDEFEGERNVRECISKATSICFRNCNSTTAPYARVIIQAILYLRSQPVPKEVTRVDRDQWLEVDYLKASQAADTCGMYRSALLFAETSSGQPVVKSSSRRSSILMEPPKIPMHLQISIYKNLDEPDSFYGVERGSDLLSVLDRLEYEGDGVKSLLFRGARLDSQMRRLDAFEPSDTRGTVKSLIMLNMNSVTHSLLSNDQFRDMGDEVVESTLHTARKLGQWDIKAPEMNQTESSTLFKAFQGVHFANNVAEAKEHFERQLLITMGFVSGKSTSSVPTRLRLRTLGALTEADEVIRAERSEHLLDTWDRMKAREKWMRAGEFSDVRQILSCRETLFNVLGSNPALVDSLRTRTGTIRNMEVEALVSSSTICRKHGALQESLASVTYLSDIVPECKSVGLDIEATAQHEVANVLWEQGETEISIRMRQHLIEHADFDSQNIDLSLPVLLARLGHHLAEARLAKPDAIMRDYLEPAIRELKSQKQGSGPGQVFHEFALFCDKQLQSPEAAEDMERIKTVMDRKLQEYHEFTKLSKTDKSKGMRETYHRSARRAKGWYDLDNAEYERLHQGREQFLRQCLENYLLSLSASDEYNNDALRVFSLWLEYADTDLANEAVKMYLNDVPSGKFALLMNQLSSRLQAEDTDFQKLLMNLVFRICVDHPYHGMHHIFAIQMKVGAITREDAVRAKDESARSRQKAASGLARALSSDNRARSYWSSIFQSNEIYHHLAMFKGEKESTQQGREISLDKYKESRDLVSKVPKFNVPPATLQVEVRANMNYSDLPRVHKFKPTMSIANGLSAPKIITAYGTDGKPYKQLFKSGNDDLRQDAIMEQVFDQVSRLLRNHTATRIRNIGIRTYKVLPLSTRSGLMEFVQNTIPLHLWVMPAHEKYYPNDYKSDRCRKDIGAAQQDSLSTRTKVWQKVAEHFHPVLRYFLLERFEDPDEWFERRLAYTRSTAAISILGHVLGLGDRHCHNILLDEKSGEVVHIDLGVSFEAGRVLPVPEVVPFRLTRDIVDAMGYTKTEGVFRRCCEFTMDTLREERESIMTLLNVLRYDPLVNWSVSTTKAKRMQEANQDTNAQNGGGTTRASTVAPGGTPAPSGKEAEEVVVHESNKKREKEEQAGEAGRALSVVEKKLSKTLSTKATVNELIQQATDEKNLAVLYMGWASYA